MNIRRWSWAMALLLGWVLLAPFASAQGNSVVIDLSTNQSIDSARIRTAAAQLTAKGAKVVVVVTDRSSGDGMDYLGQRLKALGVAPSASEGDRPPNVIIYYVSYAPQISSVLYGRDFETALSGRSEQIRTNSLNAGLKTNNPTKGLVDAINETARVIADPVAARTEPSSGFGSSLVWLIAIVAIGGLALVFIPSFLRRRSSNAQAADAQANARSRFEQAKQGAGGAIVDLGRMIDDASEKQRFDKISYPTSQAQDLERRHRAAATQFNQLKVQFDDIGERIEALPAPTVTDLEGAAGGYDGVRAQSQQIIQALGEMDALRKEFDAINAQAPAEVDRAKK